MPFLILADLQGGRSESQAKFFNMGLEPLIEQRWRNHLPTIITTRRSEKELQDGYPTCWGLIDDRNEIEQLRLTPQDSAA